MLAPPPRDAPVGALLATAEPPWSASGALVDLLAAVAASRPSWHADALCRERGDVSFFPGRDESPLPAKAVCGECLVLAECTAWALDQDGGLAGIWGGTTAPQRRRMRAARSRTTAA